MIISATLSGLNQLSISLSVGGAALTHGYYLSAFQADDRIVEIMLSVDPNRSGDFFVIISATLSGLNQLSISLSVGGATLTHGYYLSAFQADDRIVEIMLSVDPNRSGLRLPTAIILQPCRLWDASNLWDELKQWIQKWGQQG